MRGGAVCLLIHRSMSRSTFVLRRLLIDGMMEAPIELMEIYTSWTEDKVVQVREGNVGFHG